jgi:hypothetical protein
MITLNFSTSSGDGADLGCDAGRGEDGFQVGARDLEGAEAVVEHSELETHPRQVRIDQQHALQRRDRAFIVAGLGGDRGELEQHLEIGRALQHLLEGSVVLALLVGRGLDRSLGRRGHGHQYPNRQRTGEELEAKNQPCLLAKQQRARRV